MNSSETNRTITHIDLDAFFVSVSRLENSNLLNKPVLVGGGERGVVAACSYEARAFGVHSAMPMKMALRLCPEAIVIRGDYERYSYYSGIVTDIIRESVPAYEKASIDEFYLDLSGMDRFFGCYKWAIELREKIIRETGLPISFGLSANKTVSKIATGEAKPNNHKRVTHGVEKSFLAPLSVNKIPMVGEKTYQLLRGMGIEKIQTLQQMPPELLFRAFGEHGKIIWDKANGIDDTPVIPYSERKSISTEETFQQDTIDVTQLKNILTGMTEKLAFQLREQHKLAACVTVKLRYSNFDTHTMQSKIPYTSSDHLLIACAKELFERLYQRRMLVRLIGVRFSHLVGGGQQMDLFEDSGAMTKLYSAMDKLRRRFGSDAIQRAASTSYTSNAKSKHNKRDS
jgi:DNA polymerase IV